MNYSIWLNELAKYKALIDATKHTLFEREANRNISHLIPQLEMQVDQCEFTTLKIAGNTGRPLSAIVSLFQSNLQANHISSQIGAAEAFWNTTLKTVQKAASGKYVKALKDFNDEAIAHKHFQSLGAKVMDDYVILGLTVHLFDSNPGLFNQMKTWLEAQQ